VFAIVWVAIVAAAKTGDRFFWVVGAFVLLTQGGRLVVDSWRLARTYYGLTPIRALIVVDGRSFTVQSIPLDKLPELTLKEGRRARGTIQFGPDPPVRRGSFPKRPVAFEDIESAYDVYRRIMSLSNKRAP
jgi:hypothetical protein